MMLPLKQGSPNDFQTPPEALHPLYPHIPRGSKIWECADGKGNLSRAFLENGYKVYSTDILDGEEYNFLTHTPPTEYDFIITNPPFSLKQQFLERAYDLEKPFAFLLPLTTFETAKRQNLFKKHGIQVIFFDKRINFETPNKVEKSSSWFATAWFCHGFNLPNDLTFVKL